MLRVPNNLTSFESNLRSKYCQTTSNSLVANILVNDQTDTDIGYWTSAIHARLKISVFVHNWLATSIGLLRFHYCRFRFGFGRFLAKNRCISFSRFRFFRQKNVYRTTHNVCWKWSNLSLCVEPYNRWTTLLRSFRSWQFMSCNYCTRHRWRFV